MEPLRKTTRRKQKDSDPHSQKERLAWGVMSAEELKRPGAILIQLIFQTANNRNLKASSVCEALGVTYGYFSSLRAGNKPISHIGDDFTERIATFLGLPKVAVKLAAGQLRLEDFYYSGNKIHSQLEAALRFIISDPHYGPKMPLSALSVEPEIQLFLVSLYEDATGKIVLSGKVTPEDVVKRFEKLVTR
jgi:hypothetical protein